MKIEEINVFLILQRVQNIIICFEVKKKIRFAKSKNYIELQIVSNNPNTERQMICILNYLIKQ